MSSGRKRSAREIVEMLHERWKPGQLDPELAPTDMIMQRWAVSVGDGLPEEGAWNDEPHANVPPLDDATAIVVDRLIMHQLLPRYRRLAFRWYKSRQPREVIAAEMGLSRTSLTLERRSMLWYLRGLFHGKGIDC